VDGTIARWVKANKNKKSEKPKDTIQLMDGGKLESKFFKGYFWSGDMLVNFNGSEALKMELRTHQGQDFLVVEKGGFEKADGSATWHCGYHVYVRVK